jgi:large subunit ribosomal protein LP0
MGKADARAKKAIQFKRIYELFSKFQQIIVVKIMNVGSRQVQDIRRMLAKKNSYLLVGKNVSFNT